MAATAATAQESPQGQGVRIRVPVGAPRRLGGLRLPLLPATPAISAGSGPDLGATWPAHLLASASVATMKLNFHVLGRLLVGRRMSQTKPNVLLRREIQVVVGRWRDVDTRGYLEIDLVSHSGEVAAEEWIWTL